MATPPASLYRSQDCPKSSLPPPQLQGQGSGFVWDTQGHIVTNFHVIRGAAEVQVTLLDQSVYKAKIIGGEKGSGCRNMPADV
jgi:S1-C subfamily serine protease